MNNSLCQRGFHPKNIIIAYISILINIITVVQIKRSYFLSIYSLLHKGPK